MGAGAVGGGGGGRGEQDEGVLVALLARFGIDGDAPALGVELMPDGGVPAAVLGIAHDAAQGAHPVVGVTTAAGDAHESAQ